MATRTFSFRGTPYTIECTENGDQDASWFTYVDESTVRDRDWNISPGDYVIDIGCGFGSYALTALAAGAEHVYCFNPNTQENALMLKSAILNGWQSRISIDSSGLYSNTGWLDDINQVFSTAKFDGAFPVMALDDCKLELTKVNWLKMDVEGAEVEVLKGARRLLQEFRPKLLIENHTFKNPNLPALLDTFLAGQNYKTISREQYHGVSHSVHIPMK